MNSGNIDPLPVMPSRRVLCLLLLLLPFLLFWRVWAPAPEQRLVFAYGDFVEQNYLARRYVAQELRSGRVPLWDPYTFGGQPAAASSLFQVFYPVAAWQVLFPELPLLALELEAIFHLGLAGVFTFLFLQRLTGHTGAAFLGGLVFSWSGLLTSWPALQLFVLETMVWMPAGLWLLEEGLQRRALGWMALAVVAYALSIYAGHAQMVLYSAYLSGAYLIWRSWRLRLPWHFVVRAGLIVALGTLGLGALQWLPSVEQALGSQRAAWTYAELANGFRPEELLGILRPRDAAWSPLYVGVVPLGLVIAGIALAWKRARALPRTRAWADFVFWGGGAAAALLLALGQNGFLYPFFYRFVPGFAVFRNQERIAYLFVFSLVVLAAYGFAALSHLRAWRSWFTPLLVLAAAGDLYLACEGIILEPPSERLDFGPTAFSEFIAQNLSAPEARFNSEGRLPGDGNAGLLYRLRDITGNNPVRSWAYELTLQIVPEVRWWQLFNAEYVITPRDIEYPGITRAFEDGSGAARVYHLDLGGKSAWITHEVTVMPDQEAAIWYTSDMGLVDPLHTAVLEISPTPQPHATAGDEQVIVTSFAPQRLLAEVSLQEAGIVVFSEVAYPGWIVKVNGTRAEALRAFGILRAVALPAGDWRVEWVFRPASVYVGGAISILTLLIMGVGLWRSRHAGRELWP